MHLRTMIQQRAVRKRNKLKLGIGRTKCPITEFRRRMWWYKAKWWVNLAISLERKIGLNYLVLSTRDRSSWGVGSTVTNLLMKAAFYSISKWGNKDLSTSIGEQWVIVWWFQDLCRNNNSNPHQWLTNLDILKRVITDKEISSTVNQKKNTARSSNLCLLIQ
jgi:hypothetical protein